MLSFTISLPAVGAPIAWQNVMPRFVSEAGTKLLDAVRKELGTSEIYTLSDPYRKRKLAGKTKPAMRRFAGKAADQPLILDGSHIYNALQARREGDSLVVEVDPAKALSAHGFDIAAHWEEITDYLGKGFDAVEEELPGLLLEIIFEEMRL